MSSRSTASCNRRKDLAAKLRLMRLKCTKGLPAFCKTKWMEKSARVRINMLSKVSQPAGCARGGPI